MGRDEAPESDKALTLSEAPRSTVYDTAATRHALPKSMGRGSIGEAVTLPRGFGGDASEPRIVDPGGAPLGAFDPGARYANRRVLGEGGMGEVRLCADSFIGREVAMKVIRRGEGSYPDAQKRFLREARVQGQLEHPAIVPVYDIGITEQRETYFTMKRVVGRTLEEIVAGLGAQDPAVASRFPIRKLLSALVQVSLALAFAHSKEVVHRDLKPANIMLGDFGEVYVLDWGIAKIGADEAAAETPLDSANFQEGTQAGALLGTPGYMSPEQARGNAGSCDHRADIYAFGMILYEVLTLTPAHRGKTIAELLVGAMRLDGASPSHQLADIPAALDAICYRATRLDRELRFQSARELGDALESFLDGERDRERKLELAEGHTTHAEELLRSIHEEDDPEAIRTEIMRELGAALALVPSHRRAQRALLQVLVEEPEVIPAEVQQTLDEMNKKDRSRSAVGAALAYLGWFALMPFAMWMGIRQPLWIGAIGVVNLSMVAFMIWMWRTQNASPRYMRFAIMGNFILVGLLGIFFGPLIILPQSVVTLSASVMISIRANRITRLFITAGASITVVFPFVLAWLGVIPMPYTFERGLIVIHPFAVDFTPLPTVVFLTLTTVFSMITPAVLIGRGVEVLIASERRTVARAHRLQKLLPNVDPASPSRR